MNEQLRKAIEEAINIPSTFPLKMEMVVMVDAKEYSESKAKLLRVIELLVQQRDCLIGQAVSYDERISVIAADHDAELIAALKEET